MIETATCPDGKIRCIWSLTAPGFIEYHDNEWGYPVSNDFRLFEKICLEGFQAGLSWATILAKRENFRKAFEDFNFHKIAKFTEDDTIRMLQDKGIVRHRGKIEAVINNAKQALKLIQREGSLAAYFRKFIPEHHSSAISGERATSPGSIALSKALKQEGWKFVGPITIYAFMQAMGLVNDHAEDCVIWPCVESVRKKMKMSAESSNPA